MVKFEAAIANVPCSVDFATLPEASQRFIVEYGLRQYLNDGAAASLRDREGNPKTAEALAEEKAEGVRDRLAKLASGEFTRRAAAKQAVDPAERERNAIIREKLEAAARAVGKKLPKAGTPEQVALFQAMYEKNKVAIDKEVKRRLAVGADLDLSVLLGE